MAKNMIEKTQGTRQKHCDLPEVVNQFRTKQISRRDFLKTASALGMAASTVYGIVGIAPKGACRNAKERRHISYGQPLAGVERPANFLVD